MGLNKQKAKEHIAATSGIPGKKKGAKKEKPLTAKEVTGEDVPKFDVLQWAIEKYGQEYVYQDGELSEKKARAYAKELRAEYKAAKKAGKDDPNGAIVRGAKSKPSKEPKEKKVKKPTNAESEAFVDTHIKAVGLGLVELFGVRHKPYEARAKVGTKVLDVIKAAYLACKVELYATEGETEMKDGKKKSKKS